MKKGTKGKSKSLQPGAEPGAEGSKSSRTTSLARVPLTISYVESGLEVIWHTDADTPMTDPQMSDQACRFWMGKHKDKLKLPRGAKFHLEATGPLHHEVGGERVPIKASEFTGELLISTEEDKGLVKRWQEAVTERNKLHAEKVDSEMKLEKRKKDLEKVGRELAVQSIAGLKRRVEALEAENRELKVEIEGLKVENEGLKVEIEGLKAKNEELQTDVKGFTERTTGLEATLAEILERLNRDARKIKLVRQRIVLSHARLKLLQLLQMVLPERQSWRDFMRGLNVDQLPRLGLGQRAQYLLAEGAQGRGLNEAVHEEGRYLLAEAVCEETREEEREGWLQLFQLAYDVSAEECFAAGN